KKGILRHGFAFSPDVACYCAWFAPEVKSFIDYRYPLFADRAEAFTRARLALASHALENRADPQARALAEWRNLADKYDINYVVVYSFSRGSQTARIAAAACWLEPARWPWLFGDGRTLIFGWNPSAAGGPLTGDAIALGKLAFGAVPPEQ